MTLTFFVDFVEIQKHHHLPSMEHWEIFRMYQPDNEGKNKGAEVAAQPLRSRNSTRNAYIRFLNTTNRRVDVIWINYEGVRVKYKTLEPTEHFDVTSFVNHPWIFRDAETHTKLVVSSNSREVFDCPEPVYVKLKEGLVKPTRSIVTITLPLFPLREIALQSIQRTISNPADIYKLEMPASLQKELHHRCESKPRS